MAEHQKTIEINRDWLVTSIDVMNSSLLDALIPCKVISTEQLISIKETCSTNYQRVSALLDSLYRKSNKEWDSFIKCLSNKDHGYVAVRLKASATVWQKNLYDNKDFLGDNLDLQNSDLWDRLLNKAVCTNTEQESIKETYEVNRSQVCALLDLLIHKKSRKEFDEFCSCLLLLGLESVAEKITPPEKFEENRRNPEYMATFFTAEFEKDKSRTKQLLFEKFSRDFNHQIDGETLNELNAKQNSVCFIGHKGRIGTGFYIGDKNVFTCFHVITMLVQSTEISQIRKELKNHNVGFSHQFQSDNTIPIKDLVAHCPDLDYALIHLEFEPHNVEPLKIFHCPPSPGSCVHLIGYPHHIARRTLDPNCVVVDVQKMIAEQKEKFEKASKEDVQQVDSSTTIAYHCSFFYGSSGCPVFDDTGRLVAIHKGGVPDCDFHKNPRLEKLHGRSFLIECGVKFLSVFDHARKTFGLFPDVFPICMQ